MKILWALFFLITAKVIAGKNVDNTGPYKSTVESIIPCVNTTYPMAKDPSVQINFELYRSESSDKLLNGNVTVLKDTKQIKLKIKKFAWENGKWKLTYLMNIGSCNGMLLDILCRIISVKMFDATKCSIAKGSYNIHHLDINAVQHIIWSSKMEYGRMLWRNEVIVGLTTYSCWDFTTLVERI